MYGVNTNSNTNFFGGASTTVNGLFGGGDFLVGKPFIYIDSPIKLLLLGLAILAVLYLWVVR